MARTATAGELLQILRTYSHELQRRLHLPEAQFSLPTDGRGLRIKVSVRPHRHADLPNRIMFEMGGAILEIPLEVSEDFQDYELHRR